MVYKVYPVFSSLFAEDTPSSTITTANPYSIHVTAVVKDASGKIANTKKLQFNTSPFTLVLMRDDGTTIDKDPDYQSYIIDPDDQGNFSFWLASPSKTIVNTSLVVMDDSDSEYNGPILFFSSYRNTTTKYGPPLIVTDSHGVIELSGDNPFVTVSLPMSTADFTHYDTATTALLVNGNQFIEGNFNAIYKDGFQVPTNMLSTTSLNKFGYTIVNGGASIAPTPTSASASGEIVTLPPAAPLLRTLTQSPHLINHMQMLNSATTDVPVIIDSVGNIDKLQIGDSITVTVYINAYQQGSNRPNNTIFSLPPFVIAAVNIGNPITIIIPKEKLQGYGMNLGGSAGSLYIDYSLTRKNETGISAMPQTYFSGFINTVGPV